MIDTWWNFEIVGNFGGRSHIATTSNALKLFLKSCMEGQRIFFILERSTRCTTANIVIFWVYFDTVGDGGGRGFHSKRHHVVTPILEI